MPTTNKLVRPTEVKALNHYKIWLRYSDGVSGEVDLSYLAGKGIFRIWEKRKNFENVQLSESGSVTWGDEIELCPDSLYLKLTGKKPEDILPGFKTLPADA